MDQHYWLPLYSMGAFATQREEELGYRPTAGNQGRIGALREPLPCWSAFTEGHVTAEGKLSACCFDATANWTMGDLNRQSFMEAWNSEPFVKLREAHLRKDVTRHGVREVRRLSEIARVAGWTRCRHTAGNKQEHRTQRVVVVMPADGFVSRWEFTCAPDKTWTWRFGDGKSGAFSSVDAATANATSHGFDPFVHHWTATNGGRTTHYRPGRTPIIPPVPRRAANLMPPYWTLPSSGICFRQIICSTHRRVGW